MFTCAPDWRPNSADAADVVTLNSCTASAMRRLLVTPFTCGSSALTPSIIQLVDCDREPAAANPFTCEPGAEKVAPGVSSAKSLNRRLTCGRLAVNVRSKAAPVELFSGSIKAI